MGSLLLIQTSQRGLEADQKVIAAHGCYAMTATTALTAQNTQGVIDIHVTPSNFVVKQIDACIDDVGVDVVKIGMFSGLYRLFAIDLFLIHFGRHARFGRDGSCSRRIITTAQGRIDRRRSCRLHLSNLHAKLTVQVCVSTSGHQLLPQDAIKTLREEMLPLATILTPNIPEASSLLEDAGQPRPNIKSVDDLIAVAKAVRELGPKYVLLKGGHLPFTRDGRVSSGDAENHKVIDVLEGGGEVMIVESDYIRSKNTHGTGCSLACTASFSLTPGMLADVYSGNRFEPRARQDDSQCRASSMSLRRSRHQDEQRYW